MTLYAVLHRPIGRVIAFAIPDRIAFTYPPGSFANATVRNRQAAESEKNARYRRLLDAIALQVSPKPRRIKQVTRRD
jgi:hypothetical protein